MRDLEPRGIGRRVAYALALLLGIALGAHEAYTLLRPLIPTLIVLLVLALAAGLVFRGRR